MENKNMLLLSKFIKKIKNLKKNKSGATAIEYGLIAALVSVVLIGALTTLGTNIRSTFNTVASSIGSAG